MYCNPLSLRDTPPISALEDGATPDDLVVDQPITIDGWTPRNYRRGHIGDVTLRQAFAFSLNTVAAKLGQYVGYGRVADMARRFGITTPVDRKSTRLNSSH